MALPQDLPPLPLPDGVRSAYVKGVNGLDMHYLEAGKPSRPLILLLHGFPELAFSWRNLMVPLAEQGFHVIAPDQRGYGRTTGWSEAYDQDLFTSRMTNLVRDAMGLIFRLGHDYAAQVVRHDFGASVAGWAGLLRPDVFRQITVMSAGRLECHCGSNCFTVKLAFHFFACYSFWPFVPTPLSCTMAPYCTGTRNFTRT